MDAPDPGRVLARALVAWGLGHLMLGRVALGRALLIGEVVALGLVIWLVAGLADSSAYLVPFLTGIAFIGIWAWQAIDAYRIARRSRPATDLVPERSPAAAIGALSLPLLVWTTGFWLVAAQHASPSAVLDRFVSDWSAETLTDGAWAPGVVRAGEAAAANLGEGTDRFRDVRVRVTDDDGRRATAVAEAIHYERRETRFLGIFPGSELVPVADELVLTLRLASRPVELPGGGEAGAVRWELVSADTR